MTFLPPRQLDILTVARLEGRVDVEGLAKRFQVTPQTIRKDLNDLCDQEKLHRVHGGAIYPSSTENLAYLARQEIATDEKQTIAQAAARLIGDNTSVFLNIGTTTEAVAGCLRNHQGLLAITNNLNVASILSGGDGIEVIIAGGMVRKSDRGIVGAATIDLIRQFKVDWAVIGTSAIDQDGCLLDFDYSEVRVTQAILEQSRKKILVADGTKFDRRAPVQIGHLRDVDIFVTDRPPPTRVAEHCNDAGVELIITCQADQAP